MKHRIFVLIGLCAAPVLLAAALQERQKPKAAADMPALLDEATRAWEAKHFGACTKALRQAQVLVATERAKAVRAALPDAPEGFEKVAVKETEDPASNAFLAAFAAGAGNVIEQKYRETNGRASVDVTITADSPLVQMFSMWITNPAMLEAGSELVKYGPHNAVLKKQGNRWQLMLLIKSDLCDITVDGRDDEFLLKLFDQAAVDRLAAVLAN